MIRDLPALANREFDAVVVGGGIYGLSIAYDAAQRGLSVALVERGDFGAATSFNHLKTIHGGLRHLQHGDLRRMRESMRERCTLARIAPRFIAPLAFAMPLGRSLARGALAMRAAFLVERMVAPAEEDVPPSLRLPHSTLVPPDRSRELFAGALDSPAGAAIWHEYVTIEGDRLTLAFARAAAAHGAVLANYVEAAAPLRSGSAVTGVRARDNLSGQTLDIRGRLVVNAAGPWAADWVGQSGLHVRWPLLKAMNLVTSRPARQAAVVAPSPSGRALILLPWRGRLLVGTSESAETRQPDDQRARQTEVAQFLKEVNATFPALGLAASEVTLVHRGVVPASADSGRLTLLGRPRLVDHARDGGVAGLLSVVGVKYTAARLVAERAVDAMLAKLGRPPAPCRTAVAALPSAGLGDEDPRDAVLHAVRQEMANTLADVVIRRTGMGAAGYPGDAQVREVATKLQRELEWSDVRTASEIDAVRRFYDIDL